MELQYGNADPTRRRPNFWLQLTLLIGFIFCLIIGVGALAALLLVQTEPESTAGVAPITQVPVAGVAPQHALTLLAGDPPKALAHQALQAGELDLAYGITYFAVELSDGDRLALWLQLGRRYLAADQPAIALQAYDHAMTVVVLSTTLNYLERTQALLQMAEDLIRAEALDRAGDAITQAKRLAEQTPDILPAQRSQTLETLRLLSSQVDNPTLAAEIDALARNPYLTPSGAFFSAVFHALGEPVAEPVEVINARGLRHQAARALAERIRITGGVDVGPELETLATALRNEDQARNAAFQRTLSAGLTLAQQFTLIEEQRRWTALKLHVATGGFGLDIVPEWTTNVNALQQELSASNNNLLYVVDAIAGISPSGEPQAMLRFEMYAWVAQQTQLGLVGDRTLLDLSDQLRFLQNELGQVGAPPALPVAFDAAATPPGFRIVPPASLQ
jgi:hypothetical protein